MSATGRPRFVTFEGIDGAGKSTHLQWACTWLTTRSIEVVATREPGGTNGAEAIRDLLLDPATVLAPEAETLLMFAARSDHLHRVVRPALDQGQWVLCDRFTDATLAYQGYGRGVDIDRILMLADWVHGGLWPDLTLLFDLPEAVGVARRGGRNVTDRFEREQAAFHERVRQGYLALARRWPQRIRVVDATLPLADIQEKLKEILLCH